MDIKATFSERAEQFSSQEKILERSSFNYSTIRIVSFVFALVLFVIFANQRAGMFVGGIVIVFPLFFGLLVRRHNRVINKLTLTRNLRIINEEEVRRIEHKFDGLPAGDEWVDRNHPYTYDLDIFGKNSLFQMLNRTSTPSGAMHLSSWLLGPGTLNDIVRRQEAIVELTGDIHWNQTFQASGKMLENIEQKDLDRLLGWINSPAKLPGMAYKIFSLLNPLLIALFTGLVVFGQASIYIPLSILLVNGFILRKFQHRLTHVTNSTSGNAELLRSYASLIGIIERRSFDAPMLKELKTPFESHGIPATTKIHRIRRLADYLNARGNLFYQLLNFIFLLDIHLISSAEKWKGKNRDDIGKWFSNIGQVESLISLAGFHVINPDYTFPAFTGKNIFDVAEMGHPLIRKKERVSNDFRMQNAGTVIVITGSNMSGKSTFLRTVGINTVLAYSGSVVCAKKMNLSFFRLFTGMRTEDNLEEHISSFYAELKRIRKLLDYIEEGEMPVLYMLDEILKGTNTKDRHKGSAALINKLSHKKALGFVSTHDLELGELEKSNDSISNYSFNSEIRDNEIFFDYKIEKGVCHSFNASMLMKKIGILDDQN